MPNFSPMEERSLRTRHASRGNRAVLERLCAAVSGSDSSCGTTRAEALSLLETLLAGTNLPERVRQLSVRRSPPQLVFQQRFRKYFAVLGHLSSIDRLSFDNSSRFAFSGSSDSTIKLWSIPHGLLITTLRAHTSPINDLSLSPSGLFLVSADSQGVVIVWSLETLSVVHSFVMDTEVIFCEAIDPGTETLSEAGSVTGTCSPAVLAEGSGAVRKSRDDVGVSGAKNSNGSHHDSFEEEYPSDVAVKDGSNDNGHQRNENEPWSAKKVRDDKSTTQSCQSEPPRTKSQASSRPHAFVCILASGEVRTVRFTATAVLSETSNGSMRGESIKAICVTDGGRFVVCGGWWPFLLLYDTHNLGSVVVLDEYRVQTLCACRNAPKIAASVVNVHNTEQIFIYTFYGSQEACPSSSSFRRVKGLPGHWVKTVLSLDSRQQAGYDAGDSQQSTVQLPARSEPAPIERMCFLDSQLLVTLDAEGMLRVFDDKSERASLQAEPGLLYSHPTQDMFVIVGRRLSMYVVERQVKEFSFSDGDMSSAAINIVASQYSHQNTEREKRDGSGESLRDNKRGGARAGLHNEAGDRLLLRRRVFSAQNGATTGVCGYATANLTHSQNEEESILSFDARQEAEDRDISMICNKPSAAKTTACIRDRDDLVDRAGFAESAVLDEDRRAATVDSNTLFSYTPTACEATSQFRNIPSDITRFHFGSQSLKIAIPVVVPDLNSTQAVYKLTISPFFSDEVAITANDCGFSSDGRFFIIGDDNGVITTYSVCDPINPPSAQFFPSDLTGGAQSTASADPANAPSGLAGRADTRAGGSSNDSSLLPRTTGRAERRAGRASESGIHLDDSMGTVDREMRLNRGWHKLEYSISSSDVRRRVIAESAAARHLQREALNEETFRSLYMATEDAPVEEHASRSSVSVATDDDTVEDEETSASTSGTEEDTTSGTETSLESDSTVTGSPLQGLSSKKDGRKGRSKASASSSEQDRVKKRPARRAAVRRFIFSREGSSGRSGCSAEESSSACNEGDTSARISQENRRAGRKRLRREYSDESGGRNDQKRDSEDECDDGVLVRSTARRVLRNARITAVVDGQKAEGSTRAKFSSEDSSMTVCSQSPSDSTAASSETERALKRRTRPAARRRSIDRGRVKERPSDEAVQATYGSNETEDIVDDGKVSTVTADKSVGRSEVKSPRAAATESKRLDVEEVDKRDGRSSWRPRLRRQLAAFDSGSDNDSPYENNYGESGGIDPAIEDSFAAFARRWLGVFRVYQNDRIYFDSDAYREFLDRERRFKEMRRDDNKTAVADASARNSSMAGSNVIPKSGTYRVVSVNIDRIGKIPYLVLGLSSGQYVRFYEYSDSRGIACTVGQYYARGDVVVATDESSVAEMRIEKSEGLSIHVGGSWVLRSMIVIRSPHLLKVSTIAYESRFRALFGRTRRRCEIPAVLEVVNYDTINFRILMNSYKSGLQLTVDLRLVERAARVLGQEALRFAHSVRVSISAQLHDADSSGV